MTRSGGPQLSGPTETAEAGNTEPHSPRERRRTNAKWLLVLAGINVIFFWKIVFTDQFSFLIDWDNANQVYPWTQFAAKALQNGDLPLWDTYAFSGRPFLGEMQTGLFDPLKLPLYLWPVSDTALLPPAAIDWLMVFAHLLACWFMFLLAREGGMPPFAAVVAAVAFGLGGFVGNMRWPGMLDSALWLPLIFLFVWKALRAVSWQGSTMFASLGGVCLGMAVLAGSLHILIADALFIAAAALFFGLTAKGLNPSAARLWLRSGVVACLTIGIGLLVGAVQLLPSLEYAGQSVRWVGAPEPMPSTAKIPYDLLADEAALPANSLLALLLGGLPTGTAEYSPYQGILPLLLGLFAIWNRREHPWVLFLALVAGLSFFYARGSSSLLHGFAYATVPFLDKAREAGRFLYLTHFAVALLAGFGAQALLAKAAVASRSPAAFVRAVKWATVLLAFAVTTAALVRADFPGHFFLSLVFLAASYAVIALAAHGKSLGWLQFAALALIVADLSAFHTPIKNKREESRLGTNSLEFVLNARPLAEFFHAQDGRFRINIEPEEIRNLGDLYGVSAIKGGGATTQTGYDAFLANVRVAMRLLNVRYTVTKRQPEGEEPVFTLGDWRVYEHANYNPRVWLAREVHFTSTPEDTYARINEAGFDLLREAMVAVESPPALEAFAAPQQEQEAGDEDQVEIRAYGPGSMEIEVDAALPGLLIVSESFYPGWEASINGDPAALHRANGALMGVAVAKGPSVVTMRYSPQSFRLGAWITGLTLLGVLVCSALKIKTFNEPSSAPQRAARL
ncbi:MAG: YfhO family protein [Bryobacterales bacterium]